MRVAAGVAGDTRIRLCGSSMWTIRSPPTSPLQYLSKYQSPTRALPHIAQLGARDVGRNVVYVGSTIGWGWLLKA